LFRARNGVLYTIHIKYTKYLTLRHEKVNRRNNRMHQCVLYRKASSSSSTTATLSRNRTAAAPGIYPDNIFITIIVNTIGTLYIICVCVYRRAVTGNHTSCTCKYAHLYKCTPAARSTTRELLSFLVILNAFQFTRCNVVRNIIVLAPSPPPYYCIL